MRKSNAFSNILFIGFLTIILSCDNEYKTDISQTPNFVKVYGGPKMQKGKDIKITSKGEFLIFGSSNSFSTGSFDFYLLKTDARGNELWSKTFGGEMDDFGNSLLISGDGNYLLLGSTIDEEGFADILLMKVDPDGNEIWRRQIGERRHNDYGVQIKEDLDGKGYVIVGQTSLLDYKYPFPSDKPDTDISDIFILRTDLEGQVLQTRITGFNGEDLGADVLPIKNLQGADEYIIVGTSTSYDDSGKSNGSALYFFKVNKNLATNSRDIHFEEGTRGMGICQTTDGGFMLVGSNAGDGETDVLLIKTKLENDFSYVEEIKLNAPGDQQGNTIIQLQDGSFIISGTTSSFRGSDSDIYLLKVDSNGQHVWSRNFGDEGDELAGKVIPTPDGGFALIGTLNFGNNEMIYVVKTNSEGLLLPD